MDHGENLMWVWRAKGLPEPQRWQGKKAPGVPCPLHEDHRPSAWLDLERGIFGCSVCGVFTAKRLAERLEVPWPPREGIYIPKPVHRAAKPEKPAEFTPDDAARTWEIVSKRARDDDTTEEDRDTYRYIYARGLADAWELGLYGVLGPRRDDRLPWQVRWWGERGWRLVVPLYRVGGKDAGRLTCIQARHIDTPPRGDTARILAPKGGHIEWTAFANPAGLAVLRGQGGSDRIYVCEGLCDFLAGCLTYYDAPVFGTPGAGLMPKVIDEWARSRHVTLLPDDDEAGQRGAEKAAQAIFLLGGRPRIG